MNTERMRKALEQIKASVVGDAFPRWPVDMQVTYMRGWIADVCDAALSETQRSSSEATDQMKKDQS
jgi:hypothetical protein